MELISKEKVLCLVKSLDYCFKNDSLNLFQKAIEKLPNESNNKITSYWEECDCGDYNYQCHNCKGGLTDYKLSFCYDCGADMKEDKLFINKMMNKFGDKNEN